MPALGLTPTLADTLSFIKAEFAEKGASPSFDEIQQHLGLKTKSSVHRILSGLEERGHIRRERYRARSIALVQCCPHCGGRL